LHDNGNRGDDHEDGDRSIHLRVFA
jgi:hypothetical protein